jgi:hypothetical protein
MLPKRFLMNELQFLHGGDIAVTLVVILCSSVSSTHVSLHNRKHKESLVSPPCPLIVDMMTVELALISNAVLVSLLRIKNGSRDHVVPLISDAW